MPDSLAMAEEVEKRGSSAQYFLLQLEHVQLVCGLSEQSKKLKSWAVLGYFETDLRAFPADSSDAQTGSRDPSETRASSNF